MGYDNQSDMFKKRAESNEKTAKAEYAMYKKAKELGNKEEANSHYLKSQHYYKSAEENKMKAKENEGKDFSKKKSTKKV